MLWVEVIEMATRAKAAVTAGAGAVAAAASVGAVDERILHLLTHLFPPFISSLPSFFQVLSDEEIRAKYDRGEDVSGQAQQAQHHNPFGAGGPFGGGQHFTFRFH